MSEEIVTPDEMYFSNIHFFNEVEEKGDEE